MIRKNNRDVPAYEYSSFEVALPCGPVSLDTMTAASFEGVHQQLKWAAFSQLSLRGADPRDVAAFLTFEGALAELFSMAPTSVAFDVLNHMSERHLAVSTAILGG